MVLSRRSVLQGIGGSGLAGVAGGIVGSLARPRAALAGPTDADFKAMAASLDGSLERPGSSGYDVSRRLNDPRFDTVKPPAVVRCASIPDVTEALTFARRFSMPVVARGPGASATRWRTRW